MLLTALVTLAALAATDGATPATLPDGYEIPIGRTLVDIYDLSRWKKYRGTVQHPCTVIKPEDLARARQNIAAHAWAREQIARLDDKLPDPAFDDAWLEGMIPATTPLSVHFTMCPKCEYSPTHGQYDWKPEDPDKLTCKGCATVYPNDAYPEDLVIETTATGPQRFSWYGGKSWFYYGYHIHSSWSGHIRSRKVGHMIGLLQRYATAYALTGEIGYARAARRILLRFAEVYPDWLIHCAYDEVIDLPPKQAAVLLMSLPVEEKVLPPNKPDRRLQAGYWMAGKAAPSGQEGGFIAAWVQAYDLTCEARDGDKPLYTPEEREHIERDLLIESTYLPMSDISFNNKSISNRRGTALVGACVGDPMRVRYGLEALDNMLAHWYLPDGTPGECPGYGLMTLRGLLPMSEGLRGYSDPPGFMADGYRFDNYDPYARSDFRGVFTALTRQLLPDLSLPAWADTLAGASLAPDLAEMAATRYPGEHTLALRERAYNGKLSETGDRFALLHRDPSPATAKTPLTFASRFWPSWKAAWLRFGERGQDGSCLLTASPWGGHHQHDSLNLGLYWRDQECLTDLGYLWDSPNKRMSSRTLAHNLLLIDEQEQITTGRQGHPHLFDPSGPFPTVEMSSTAYTENMYYRRTLVAVPIGERGVVVVDFFRAGGGATHDLVYHGPDNEPRFSAPPEPADAKLYDLTDVAALPSAAGSSITWNVGGKVRFEAINLPEAGEQTFVGAGWGSRRREDTTTRIPYVVRRRGGLDGHELSRFATVFVMSDLENPLEVKARRLELKGSAVGVAVTVGESEYLVLSQRPSRKLEPPLKIEGLISDAQVTVHAREREQRQLYILGGTMASAAQGLSVMMPPSVAGAVVDRFRSEDGAGVVLHTAVEQPEQLTGLTLVLGSVEDQTGYAILKVESEGDERLKIWTRVGGEGFDPIDARIGQITRRAVVSSSGQR